MPPDDLMAPEDLMAPDYSMTLDEARLMANVNGRAQRLFEDGYRARWGKTGQLEVRSRKGTAYEVDPLAQTCDCPFYRAHQGRHPCKHSLGWRLLLAKQRAVRRLVLLLLLRTWADLDDGSRCTPEGICHD